MSTTTLKILQQLLADFGKLVALLSIIIFLINRLKYSKEFGWIISYLFFNLIISILAGYFWKREMNNLPLLHLNTLIEFFLFSVFYKYLLIDLDWFRKNIWGFIVVVCLMIIGNSIFFESIYTFNINSKTLVQIILIGYSVLYIYSYSIKLENVNPEKQAIRLINAAVLIYYASSLFIFLFGNVFLKNDIKMHQGFWVVNAGLNLIFQLIILFGIWKVAFKPKTYI